MRAGAEGEQLFLSLHPLVVLRLEQPAQLARPVELLLGVFEFALMGVMCRLGFGWQGFWEKEKVSGKGIRFWERDKDIGKG